MQAGESETEDRKSGQEWRSKAERALGLCLKLLLQGEPGTAAQKISIFYAYFINFVDVPDILSDLS